MMTAIQNLGRIGVDFCQHLGVSGLFLCRTIVRKPRLSKSFPLLLEQIYFVEVLSAVIILVSGLFIVGWC